MVRANEQYTDLQNKKKSLIDSVMETETFNKAKEILSKYAPEKLEKKVGFLIESFKHLVGLFVVGWLYLKSRVTVSLL